MYKFRNQVLKNDVAYSVLDKSKVTKLKILKSLDKV